MPPKNRISVTRKIHMPSVAAARCWPMSEKWCSRAWLATTSVLPCNRHLRDAAVVVGFPGHDRGFFEVGGRRRRGRAPFQPGCAPRIVGGDLSVLQRKQQVEQRQDVA